MEKRVNFAVVKEKIIKTDELLNLYEDKNTKLIKLSHAYKEAKSKYETAVAEINRLRMENDRLNFNLDSLKPKMEQNELELFELREDHARLEEKYQQTLINSQNQYKSLEKKIDSCNCDKDMSSGKTTKSPSELKAEEKAKDLKEKLKQLQQQHNDLKKENAAFILKNRQISEEFEKEKKRHAADVQIFHNKNDHLLKEINRLKLKLENPEHDLDKTTGLELVLSSLECEKDFEVKKLQKEVRRLSVERTELRRLKSECEDLKKHLSPQKKDCQVQTDQKILAGHSQCARKIDFGASDSHEKGVNEHDVIEGENDNDCPSADNDICENDHSEDYSSEDSVIYKEFCLSRLAFDKKMVKGVTLSPMSNISEHPGTLNCLSPIHELMDGSNNIPNITLTPPTPMVTKGKSLIFDTFQKISSTPEKKPTEFERIRPRRRKFIMPYQNDLLSLRALRSISKRALIRKKQKSLETKDTILEALKALQECNISFTISNDTKNSIPLVPQKITETVPKTDNLSEETINCWSDKACAVDQNAKMMNNIPGHTPELVGFFDVKDESTAPNHKIFQKLVSGIEQLVKLNGGSKAGPTKKRRRRNDVEFRTETETEIEKLFVEDREDVLARNRLLLEAAMRERRAEEESDFLGDSGLVSPGTSSSFVRGTPEGLVSKLSDHPSLTSEPLESELSKFVPKSPTNQERVSRSVMAGNSEYKTLIAASKSLENLVSHSESQLGHSPDLQLPLDSQSNNSDKNNCELETKLSMKNESFEKSCDSPNSLSEVPLDPPPKLEENFKEYALDEEKERLSLDQLHSFCGFEISDNLVHQQNVDFKTEDPVKSELYSKPLLERFNLIETKVPESVSFDTVETPVDTVKTPETKINGKMNLEPVIESTEKPFTPKKLVIIISEKDNSPCLNKSDNAKVTPIARSLINDMSSQSPSLRLLNFPESPQKIVYRNRLKSESSVKSDAIPSPSFRLRNKKRITTDSEDDTVKEKKPTTKRSQRILRRKSQRLNKSVSASDSENESPVRSTPIKKRNLRNRSVEQKSSNCIGDTTSSENLTLKNLKQKLEEDKKVCEKRSIDETEHVNEKTRDNKKKQKNKNVDISCENRRRLRSDDKKIKSKEFLSDSVDSVSEDNSLVKNEEIGPQKLEEKDTAPVTARSYSLRSSDKNINKNSSPVSIACQQIRLQRKTKIEKSLSKSSKMEESTPNVSSQGDVKVVDVSLSDIGNGSQTDNKCKMLRSTMKKSRRKKSCNIENSAANMDEEENKPFINDKRHADSESEIQTNSESNIQACSESNNNTATESEARLQLDTDSVKQESMELLDISCHDEVKPLISDLGCSKQEVELLNKSACENLNEEDHTNTNNSVQSVSQTESQIAAQSSNIGCKKSSERVEDIDKCLSNILSKEGDNFKFQCKLLADMECSEEQPKNEISSRVIKTINTEKSSGLNNTSLKRISLTSIFKSYSDTESVKSETTNDILSDHNYCSSSERSQIKKSPVVKTIVLSVKPTEIKGETSDSDKIKEPCSVGEKPKSNSLIRKVRKYSENCITESEADNPKNNYSSSKKFTATILKRLDPNKEITLKNSIRENSENSDSETPIGLKVKIASVTKPILRLRGSSIIESETDSIKSSCSSKKLTATIVKHLEPNKTKENCKFENIRYKSDIESSTILSSSCHSDSEPLAKLRAKILKHSKPTEQETSKKKHLTIKDLFGDSSEDGRKYKRQSSSSSDSNNDGVIAVSDNFKAKILSLKKNCNETTSKNKVQIDQQLVVKSTEQDLFGDVSDSDSDNNSDTSSTNSSLLIESAGRFKKPTGTLRANILKHVRPAKSPVKAGTESFENISKLPAVRPADRINDTKIKIVQDIRISKEGLIIDLDNLGACEEVIDVKPKIEPKSEVDDSPSTKNEERIRLSNNRKAMDVKRKLDLKCEDVPVNQEPISQPRRKVPKLVDTSTTTADTDIVSKLLQDMIKSKPKTARKNLSVNNMVNQRNLPATKPIQRKHDSIVETADSSFDDYDCPRSPDMVETPEMACLPPKIIPTEKPKKMPDSRVRVLFNKLMVYSREENVVDEIVASFATQEDSYIAEIIVQKVASDFHDKAEKTQPSAPPLTLTQRILLGFMARLTRSSHPDIYNKFLTAAEMQLYDKMRCELKMVAPITRLYTAICKLRRDINRMRRFCCEGFYFMENFAIPMFFTVLTMWAEVLPMEVNRFEYPQAKVLVQLCYLKDCNQQGYNLIPLRDLLHKFFGYPTERWNCDEVFQEVLIQYLRNPAVRLSDFTLLLFLKNKPTKWVYQKMRENIMPLVETIPVENANLKATLMILIGNICHNFNRHEEYDLTVIAEMKTWLRNWEKDNTSPILTRSIQLAMSRIPNKPKKPKKAPEDPPKKDFIDWDAPQMEANSTGNLCPKSSSTRQQRSYKGVTHALADLESEGIRLSVGVKNINKDTPPTSEKNVKSENK